MISMNKLFIFLFIIIVVSGCNNSTAPQKPDNPTTQKTTISGLAFDSTIVNGKIDIFDWSLGNKGELLKTSFLDSSGNYYIDLISTDKLLLIEISEGYYIEEASGQQVILNNNSSHKLTMLVSLVKGQNIIVHTTILTTIAHGLAEYFVSSNQLTPSNAIIQANSIISSWVGFPVRSIKPISVSSGLNTTSNSIIPDSFKYGYFSAAISELSKQEYIASALPGHDKLASIDFAKIAFEDISLDGILNGISRNGAIKFGKALNINVDTYRELLATRLMQFSTTVRNNGGVNFDKLKIFAAIINNGNGAIFDNSVAPDISLKKAVISEVTPTNDITFGGDYISSAKIIDIFGVLKVDFFVDNTLVSTLKNTNNPKFTIDVSVIGEGAHTLKIITTNLMKNKTEVSRGFTIIYDVPTISGFSPADGSTITNTYIVQATITDTYGLQTVKMYLDNVLLAAPANMAGPSHTIDIATINEGAHNFKIVATNQLGKSSTIVNNFTVIKSAPIIDDTKFLPIEGDTVIGSFSARVEASDVYGITLVEYYIDTTFVVAAGVGSEPTYIRSINSRNFTNGPHTLKVIITNVVGKNTSLSHNIIIAN